MHQSATDLTLLNADAHAGGVHLEQNGTPGEALASTVADGAWHLAPADKITSADASLFAIGLVVAGAVVVLARVPAAVERSRAARRSREASERDERDAAGQLALRRVQHGGTHGSHEGGANSELDSAPAGVVQW